MYVCIYIYISYYVHLVICNVCLRRSSHQNGFQNDGLNFKQKMFYADFSGFCQDDVFQNIYNFHLNFAHNLKRVTTITY
jgi:hypothetical protein